MPAKGRYYTIPQCKEIATRISREMKTYEADRRTYDHAAPGAMPADLTHVPIWPPDFDLTAEKIRQLYHPAEAAVIIDNLTA